MIENQKFPLINNLDLLYSKLNEDSLESLIKLDKDFKERDSRDFTVKLESKKQKQIVEKILILSGYSTISNSSSLEISIDIY